ncbi:MAG TPA: dihydroneopterin aldolase [Anaerolineaceae bacterium]|nr:dihydroneopterin aldolase [Anaerolineaceae bacterium]
MDKIIITDLRATGIVGIKSPERDQPQTLLVNITLLTDLKPAGLTDNIKDTISYSTVAKSVIARVAETQFYTLEALAEDLAKMLLKWSGVRALTIRIEKPDFVANTSRVGVEIFRKAETESY